MNPITRTSHQKPFARASIQQPKHVTLRHASQLAQAASHIMSASQKKAYEQGIKDAESSTRDHPPYGFSDLKQAWRMGWLAGSQKNKGLNSASRASSGGKSA